MQLLSACGERERERERERVDDVFDLVPLRVRVGVRVSYFVATRGHKGVLGVRQRCGRRR